MIFKKDGKLYIIIFDTSVHHPDPVWYINGVEYTRILSVEEEDALLAEYHAKIVNVEADEYLNILPTDIDPTDVFEIYEFETEQDYMFFCLRFN